MRSAGVRKEKEQQEAKKEAEGLLQIGSEHRLRSENLAFDIDVWYPNLERFTFPTEFLPLTRAEAVAILHYQDARFSERPRLTGADVRLLRALEKRIDQVLRAKFPDGAFLRLCGRSPKEGTPLDRRAVIERYNAEVRRMLDAGEPMSANVKLRAISRTNTLRVGSGADAMSLLLTSERVFADLHDWIQWGEPEQIVLRKFEPELCLEYEFRGFVYQGKLNALSQYDHYAVYPQLQSMKAHIQAKIEEFWREVHPHVGEESYVMDFAYLPKSDKITLIELSPFLPCTGPALFKWGIDRQRFEQGPFEFRLQTTLHPHIDELLEVNWDDRWNNPVARYDTFYSLATTPEIDPQLAQQRAKLLTMSAYATAASCALAIVAIATAQHQPVAATLAGASSLASLVYSSRCRRQLEEANSLPPKTHLLFCYGTLKRNFHWNKKFLGQAEFVVAATTDNPVPLVVGDSGVPYLLGDLPPGQGKRVRGELWRLDDVTLLGLDEYEGLGKGYYARVKLPVTTEDGSKVEAQVYVKTTSSEKLRAGPFLEEYTLEFHKANYRAIRHIMVKQQMYLNTQLGRVET